MQGVKLYENFIKIERSTKDDLAYGMCTTNSERWFKNIVSVYCLH